MFLLLLFAFYLAFFNNMDTYVNQLRVLLSKYYYVLGRLVYAINGPTSSVIPVQGLTIDPEAETVIDHWAIEEVSLK